jgi:phospholipase C
MYSSAVLRAAVLATIAVILNGCGGGASQGPGPQPTTFDLTVSAGSGGNVTSSPSGINCGSACIATFSSGTKVTLSATPSSGDSFANWSGACSGSSPTCTLTMNGSTAVSATFNHTQVQLSVSETGGGTITSSPAGINCGAICSTDFNTGSSVTLTATPAAGNSFNGWTGACSGSSTTCALVLNAASSVAASFNATRVQLSVSETGSGTGTITSNPAGIDCQSCAANFPVGSTVTLTAAPNASFVFNGWSGACSGTGTCTVSLNAAASVVASFSATLQSINHIIFMAQENRGFLEYFGALPKYWAESNGKYEVLTPFDGLPQFANSPGPIPTNPGCNPGSPYPSQCGYDANNPVQSYHTTNKCTELLSPFWDYAHRDFNFADPTSTTPTLDGFVVAAGTFARYLGGGDLEGMRAMGYYTGDDLNYYYFMASNFATSDRWFSPNMSDTRTNRMYMLAATSQGHVYQLSAAEGLSTNTTIFEELQNAGISWKVYVTDPNPTLVAGSAMAQYSFSYKFLQNFVPASQFLTDAANGTLPQVAMIEPGYQDGSDEHPFEAANSPGGSVQRGALYVSGLINAVMNGPSWKDSVFVLTYDEFGGFYDNVPPQPAPSPDDIAPVDLEPGDICYGGSTSPLCNFDYTGYRVPLIVVSPFTKRHYISHTVADYTAILKFIETRFGVAPLTKRDAAQMDMTEFFDFVNAPWTTPPSPPAQTVSGPCTAGP